MRTWGTRFHPEQPVEMHGTCSEVSSGAGEDTRRAPRHGTGRRRVSSGQRAAEGRWASSPAPGSGPARVNRKVSGVGGGLTAPRPLSSRPDAEGSHFPLNYLSRNQKR